MSLMSPEMIHITEAFKILELTGVYGKHSMHKSTLEKLGLRCVQGPKFGRGYLWFCYKDEVLALKQKMNEDAAKASSLVQGSDMPASFNVSQHLGNLKAYCASIENLCLNLHKRVDALDKKMDRMLELRDAVPERGQSAITFATTTANTDPF